MQSQQSPPLVRLTGINAKHKALLERRVSSSRQQKVLCTDAHIAVMLRV